MSRFRCSQRNDLFNRFCAAFQQGTRGLIRNLSLGLSTDEYVVVRGDSRSYCGIHRAICITQQFTEKPTFFAAPQLLLSVDGHLLELPVIHARCDEDHQPVSTLDARKRFQLTIATSA